MLYNIMQYREAPHITKDSFFCPGNYTPFNFAMAQNGHGGNFDFYTKTSFVVADIGLPIVFGHTYNSYLSDLPKEFFRAIKDDSTYFYLQPLGKGFSHSYHSYHSYLLEFDPAQIDTTYDESYYRVVHVLPEGTIHVYKKENNIFVPETKGVYRTLTQPIEGTFEIKTRDQVLFRYTRPADAVVENLFLLESTSDRNDNTISLLYEDANVSGFKRLQSINAVADDRDLFFFYHDDSDLLARVEDPLERKILFSYDDFDLDGQNRLLSFTDAKEQTAYYHYENDLGRQHLLQEIELPKGNRITNNFNVNRQISSIVSGEETRNYLYNRSQNVLGNLVDTLQVESSSYGITQTIFNKNGVPKAIQTPQSDNIRFDYLNDVVLPSSIEINNVLGEYDWDVQGNLLQANLPEGVIHTFTYTGFNDLETYTNPKGEEWSYSYNISGNLTAVTTPRGTTNFLVNNLGQTTQTTTPENVVMDYEYNSTGDLINTSIAAENISAHYTYDDIGRLVSSFNPNNIETTYQYDPNDNVLSTNFIYSTQYGYDANDNLIEVINAKGFPTTLTYDHERDFLKSVTFGGFTDEYEYEPDGRLKKQIDPNGIIFNYLYDNQRRLERVQATNDNVQYTYDNRNRIITIKNTSGQIQFVYDDLDRIIQTVGFWQDTVRYEYDKASNIEKIIYPGSKEVNYTYAADNLLLSVRDWNEQTTGYTYREDGTLASINYPNGTSCWYQYDQAGRNTGFHWLKPNGIDTICSYRFTLDAMGQHLAEHRNEPLGPPELEELLANYSYDDVNRIEMAENTNFSFENRGTAQTKEALTYTFDDYERLISLSTGESYRYDALGHRRSAVRNQVTARFVLDIVGMSQVLMEMDESENPIDYYVYGLGLISRIKPDNSTRYYHADYRGSTIAMTDENGLTTHEYSYGPFGEKWQSEEEDFNAFRYVGRYGVQYEGDDLYFMRARYYDAEIGRFLSEDPVWATNLYPYAGNNSISNIDENGKSARSIDNRIIPAVPRGYNSINVYKIKDYNSREITRENKLNNFLSGLHPDNWLPSIDPLPSYQLDQSNGLSRESTNRSSRRVLKEFRNMRKDFDYKKGVDWISLTGFVTWGGMALLRDGIIHMGHTYNDIYIELIQPVIEKIK